LEAFFNQLFHSQTQFLIMKNFLTTAAMLLLVVGVTLVSSCKKDDPAATVVASFTFEIDAADATTVHFTSTSVDAKSLTWNFGDGTAFSNELNPSHTYTTGGDFTVTLTATDKNGKDESVASKTVTIVVPTVELTLEGGPWKIRNAENSIVVGPGLGDGSWWQTPLSYLAGQDADVTNDWSCILNDEFIFNTDGTFEYKTNGDARNDNGIFGSPNGCVTDAHIAASQSPEFGSGTHTYTVIPAASSPSGRPIIVLTNGPGRAAFIGFNKGYYGGENNGSSPNGGNTTNQYEIMALEQVGNKAQLTVSVDISAAHDGSAAWTMVLVR
jgi:PKD repeat protein